MGITSVAEPAIAKKQNETKNNVSDFIKGTMKSQPSALTPHPLKLLLLPLRRGAELLTGL